MKAVTIRQSFVDKRAHGAAACSRRAVVQCRVASHLPAVQLDRVSVLNIQGQTTEYRGLVLDQDADKGHILVKVPSDCLLSTVPESETDPRMQALMMEGPQGEDASCCWQISLALQVLYHRFGASLLSQYISTLPGIAAGSPTPTVGYCFSPAAIEALQYSPLQAELLNFRQQVQAFWETSLAPLSAGPPAADPFRGGLTSLELLDWAVAVSTSRAFKSRANGGRYMVQTIDMANHSLAPNCTVVVSASDGAVGLVTTRGVKAGAEVQLQYGPFSNELLLQTYGFVLEGNPYDTFRFSFSIDTVLAVMEEMGLWESTGPGGWQGLQPWQEQALEQLSLAEGQASNELVAFCRSPQLVQPRLLAAVRVLTATEWVPGKRWKLQDWMSWDSKVPSDESAVPVLAALAAAYYQSFPTTLEQDTAVLARLKQQQEQERSQSHKPDNEQPQHSRQQPPEQQKPQKQQKQQQDGRHQVSQLHSHCGADVQLAVAFRIELKRLLLEVLQGLLQKC